MRRLKSLGLSSEVGKYFSSEKKYLPGEHEVEIIVNGSSKDFHTVAINKAGELCVDHDILTDIGILDNRRIRISHEKECKSIQSFYPDSVVKYAPESDKIELILPNDAIDKRDTNHYYSGGFGAVLNYDAYASRSASRVKAGRVSRFKSINLFSGLNFFDWALRGNQSYLEYNGSRNVIYGNWSAKRTLRALNYDVQVGQQNLNSDVISGSPFTGVQFSPTQDMSSGANEVTVEGVATAATNRIEIRQAGILIYTTIVPAGKFSLDDVPLHGTGQELNVKVISDSNVAHSFTIPVAAFKNKIKKQGDGFQFSFGKTKVPNLQTQAVNFFSIGQHQKITSEMGADYAFLQSKYYFNAASNVVIKPFSWGTFTSGVAASNWKNADKKGLKSSLSLRIEPTEYLSSYSSISHYSKNYREFSESLSMGHDKSSFSSLSWDYGISLHTQGLGRLSFYTGQNRIHGITDLDNKRFGLSWNKSVFDGNLSVSWQKQSLRTKVKIAEEDSYSSNNHSDKTLFVTWDRSFGDSMINSSYRKDGHSSSIGEQYTTSINSDNNYTLSVEDSLTPQKTKSINSILNSNLHYVSTTVSGGYSNVNENYSGRISGGLVAHRHGLTASPYKIKETFGIANIEPPVSGVDIKTSQGDIYTDYRGYAVVSNIRPWHESWMDVNTNKLPKNIDIQNGHHRVFSGYGAVSNILFKVLVSHRVMLKVMDKQHHPIRKGSEVHDNNNNFVTNVIDDGKVFINDIKATPTLYISDENNNSCKVNYQYQENNEQNELFSEASAECI